MKAFFISNDPLLFNPASAVRARMRAYAKEIGELHIISRARQDSHTVDGPLTLHGIPASKLTGWRQFAEAAHAVIVEQGIEVVSAQDPFEYGYIARRAVAGTGAKLHLQVHTDFLSPWFTRAGIFRSPQVTMPLKNAFRRKIAGSMLRSASGIRVVSERIKASLIAEYGTSIPVPAVLPIVPSTRLPEAIPFPVPTRPFTLVTISRLEPEKRIQDILEALAQVHERYPAIGLVIIGEGRERARLEDLVTTRGLTECVTFLGAHRDAWGLMRSAQGYIHASAYEGYGMTLIEAALARVPIISTDVGIIGEVLSGIEDALVSPPGDPTNLAYHIIALIEDTASRELRVRNAEAKALAHVSRYQDFPVLIASDLARVLSVSV